MEQYAQGSLRHCKAWLVWSDVAQRDTQGETMTDDELRSGEAGIVQKQADDALLESEPRYHALLCLPKR
jgi:hypothetical protein